MRPKPTDEHEKYMCSEWNKIAIEFPNDALSDKLKLNLHCDILEENEKIKSLFEKISIVENTTQLSWLGLVETCDMTLIITSQNQITCTLLNLVN